MRMRAIQLSGLAMALAACQAGAPAVQDPVAEGGPGPMALVETTVAGVGYVVDLGLTYEGRAGDVHISDYGHPELAGNPGLALTVARQACTEDGRMFDESVAPLSLGGGSWLFAEACR